MIFYHFFLSLQGAGLCLHLTGALGQSFHRLAIPKDTPDPQLLPLSFPPSTSSFWWSLDCLPCQ